jgi:hypothetical protein
MQLGLAVLLLAAGSVGAVDKEAVNRAVDGGVRNLRAVQGDGVWPHDQIGLTALAGLTLLECDVPVDDDLIQKAAAAVRKGAISTEQTYSISLAILFLDRLGEPVDVALIESLTVRLLAGQGHTGAWGYICPRVHTDENRLTTLVKNRAEHGPDKSATKPEPGTRTVKDMPKEIQGQLDKLQAVRAARGQDLVFPGDNSNTQFAILALWVSRRHGLPVDGALGATEQHFRRSVEVEGGWGYIPNLMPGPRGPAPGVALGNASSSRPAMTCAGLLGVGVAYGAWNESALRTDNKGKDPARPGAPAGKPKDPSKDQVVVNAFRLLGFWVDGMAAAQAQAGGKAPRIDNANGKFYYFLWSLERVCVAYSVDKIGKTDWYDWGAEILLANQGHDGGWNNGEFHIADTCFALLFLRRANLAKDLSRALKSQMKDGMQTALHQGGLGGAELVKGGGRKAFFDKSVAEDKAAAGASTQAAKLGKQLATAGEDKQDQILKELREGKGAAYTEALAAAIPQLEGEARKKAREALAERMSRMTSETLGVKLEDDDPEVRRAAALAVAMKDDKAHTYKLIELLSDRETAVARAAYAALKEISREDFGPTKEATREQRAKAILAWKGWWAKQQEKK